jgi:hypothetical protein
MTAAFQIRISITAASHAGKGQTKIRLRQKRSSYINICLDIRDENVVRFLASQHLLVPARHHN